MHLQRDHAPRESEKALVSIRLQTGAMDQEPNGAVAGTSPLQNGLSSSSSSFLTKAQQAALDSALEKKEKAASACFTQ